MKTVFVCPFNLDRLTGTPIRTKVTIRTTAKHRNVALIASGGTVADVRAFDTGRVSFFYFSKRALSILRAEKPDVVHGITTVSIVPMLLYKLTHPRVRIFFEMHGWAWFEQEHGNLLTRALLLVLDLIGLWFANKVIVMSETQRTFLAKRTLREKRIIVIWGPSEFEAEFIDPPSTEGIVVGYIGNDAWWQGLDTVIGAARHLEHAPGISFVLAGFDAGDGKKFPRLPHVSYAGRVERKDVPGFLRGCDVLVSSRVNEGVSHLQYPQKLSEYLGAGRPVVVSAANDQPLIVKSAGCGSVVNPMTPENLAAAIQAFADMPRQTRREWGMNALTFARENFFADAFARKIHALY